MHTCIVKFLLIFCVVAAVAAQTYTNKYDNLNLDQILTNDRLMKNYVYCLLGKGRCTRDGAELKRLVGDALQTGCSKCNEKQKAGTKRVIHFLITNRPQWWHELETKYDPQGTYRRRYQDELRREGFIQYG